MKSCKINHLVLIFKYLIQKFSDSSHQKIWRHSTRGNTQIILSQNNNWLMNWMNHVLIITFVERNARPVIRAIYKRKKCAKQHTFPFIIVFLHRIRNKDVWRTMTWNFRKHHFLPFFGLSIFLDDMICLFSDMIESRYTWWWPLELFSVMDDDEYETCLSLLLYANKSWLAVGKADLSLARDNE